MPAKKPTKKTASKAVTSKRSTKTNKVATPKVTTKKKETPLELQASFARILLYIIALSVFIIFFLS